MFMLHYKLGVDEHRNPGSLAFINLLNCSSDSTNTFMYEKTLIADQGFCNAPIKGLSGSTSEFYAIRFYSVKSKKKIFLDL